MRPMIRAHPFALPLGAMAFLLAACSPSRYLVVESDPPGAIVRLDDILIGRTPVEAPFEHYGKRRLTVYLEGYQTYVERIDLNAPWHATFPIDVVTEVIIPLGIEHRENIFVDLVPDTEQAEDIDPADVIDRARAVRETVRRPEPTRPEREIPATEADGSDSRESGSRRP